MTAKSHVVTSVTIALAPTLMFCSALDTVFTFVSGIVLGSLMPDIDEPNSSISHKLPFLSLFFSNIKHRTLTHNFLAEKDFVLISSHGGINFYMGNNKYATVVT